MKMDVVIPLGTGSSSEDLELKFLLRSLDKNYRELGNIYLVGHKPSWIQNVIHLPCEDPNKKNKDANLMRKVLLACKQTNLSEEFIRMSDDYVFLEKVEDIPILTNKTMLEYFNLRFNGHPLNRWGVRYRNTMNLFKGAYNFDTHAPVPIKKNEFILLPYIYNEMFEERKGYIINSLYFNHFKYIGKDLGNYKCTIEKPLNTEEIVEGCKGKAFLNYNNKGFNEDLIKFLYQKFDKKSKFEK